MLTAGDAACVLQHDVTAVANIIRGYSWSLQGLPIQLSCSARHAINSVYGSSLLVLTSACLTGVETRRPTAEQLHRLVEQLLEYEASMVRSPCRGLPAPLLGHALYRTACCSRVGMAALRALGG